MKPIFVYKNTMKDTMKDTKMGYFWVKLHTGNFWRLEYWVYWERHLMHAIFWSISISQNSPIHKKINHSNNHLYYFQQYPGM
jgi:hypothetical protein